MFKAMDSRNDTHLKGRKLELFVIRFLKNQKEALKLKRKIQIEKENKMRLMNERNTLTLARTVMDGLDDDAIVEPCPGCPNCTEGVDCFRITVYK